MDFLLSSAQLRPIRHYSLTPRSALPTLQPTLNTFLDIVFCKLTSTLKNISLIRIRACRQPYHRVSHFESEHNTHINIDHYPCWPSNLLIPESLHSHTLIQSNL